MKRQALELIRPPVLASALLALASSSLSANLLELNFQSTTGEARILAPSDQYVNPAGAIEFALSAGLDRRVRVSIVDETGNNVGAETSNLIGVEDRITVDGRSYYGHRLSMPAPADGRYTLKAEILSSAGDSVSESTYPLIIDTTPPVIPNPIEYVQRVNGGSIEVFRRPGAGRELALEGLYDELSGLQGAVYFTVDEHGVRRETENLSKFSERDGSLAVGLEVAAGAAMAPNDQATYEIGFEVYDRAGNRASISRYSDIDNIDPEWYVEVRNTQTGEWERYTPGIMVYSNPVDIRFVRNRDDHVDFNGTNFGWHDAYDYVEGDKIINNEVVRYPHGVKLYRRFTKAGGMLSQQFGDFNFTLAPGVNPFPYIQSISFGGESSGWVTANTMNDRTIRFDLPNVQSFDALSISVEPRAVDQEVRINAAWFPDWCLIPAGENECLIENLSIPVPEGAGRQRFNVNARMNGLLANDAARIDWHYDANPPRIVDVIVDPGTKSAEMVVHDEDRVNNSLINKWRTIKFDLNLAGPEGEFAAAYQGYEELTLNDNRARFSLAQVPSGSYMLEFTATDTFKNRSEPVTVGPVLIDNDDPSIEIGLTDRVRRLEDISVYVSDATTEAALVSVEMAGGPANDKINLAWRSVGDAEFKLEYPLMFPTILEGEEYTLTVRAMDEQGNATSEQTTFAFDPGTSLVNGEDGILIPAVPSVIRGEGLPPLYSDPVRLDEETLVVGQYDLVVKLREDSDFGLNVMGYEVRPGDTVIIDQYDFSSNGSRIALPIHPTDPVVGHAHLLILPSAPGAEYVVANITSWLPNPLVQINGQKLADGLQVQQALENIEMTLAPGEGDRCTYTSSPEQALSTNPLTEPMCLIDWTLPSTMTWDPEEMAAAGYLVGVGEQIQIGHRIFLAQSNNARAVEVDSRTADIDVIHPRVQFDFDPNEPVVRYITEFHRQVRSSGPLACTPTVNPADARLSTRFGRPLCLIEWNAVPPGVRASQFGPSVQGVAEQADLIEFFFDATYYDPDMNSYLLPEQRLAIEVDPPKPIQITLPESDYDPGPDGTPRYFVGQDGGQLGYVGIGGSGADMDIEISMDGEVVQSLPYYHRGGRARDANHEFRAWLNGLNLWQEHSVAVDAAYRLMPEIADSKVITVIGVPSEQIRLQVDIDERRLVDTDAVTMTARLDGRILGEGYDPEIHGEWEVQFRYDERETPDQPVSEWATVNGQGNITTDIELGDRSDGYLYAVARAKSPYEDYEREIRSNRTYITVLRGGEIDGYLSTTRVSGASTFSAFLRVRVAERDYASSLGDVDWLISYDEGATWSEVEEGARGATMRAEFPSGRYWVKARLHNRYTGVVSETGVQEFHVFDVPRVDVSGPQNAFKTQEVELVATANLDREPVPVENYLVEWTYDDGATWTEGASIVARFDGEADRVSYQVRIRDRDAPMDQDGIYRTRIHRLNFIDPEGPRTRIIGPRRLERDSPGEYRVEMSTPRRNMDIEMEGEWVLPDGTTIPGDEPIEYNPTEEDAHEGMVSLIYRSWVKGYRDQGAIDERVHRVSAWQYVWPQWDVFANTRALEAPAEIRLTPRTPGWFGWLDNEVYEWTFPEGATLLNETGNRPTVRIEEPGEHLIKLRVSDARGHETEVVKSLSLAEPAETTVAFSYYTDNPYLRAPLEVRPRILMQGGHRLDRVQEREILVNGVSVARDAQVRSFRIEQPGTYEVTAKIYTTMGREVSTSQTLEVVPNKPPVCRPEVNDRFGYPVIESNCADEDGRIVEIRWELNGEELSSNSYKYRFTTSQLEAMGGEFTVYVSARDDAGAFSARESVTYRSPQ